MRPVPGEPRLSVGVAALTWLVTWVAAFTLSLAVLAATGYLGTKSSEYPGWVTPVVVSVLWIPVLIGLRIVSNTVGTRRMRDDFGLRFRRVDLLGIPLGVVCQLVLLELVYLPLRALWPGTFGRPEVEAAARDLFDRSTGFWRVAIVAIVVIGAPLVEELLYRGLILRALDSRLNDVLALVLSALWFAAAHLQGVQFPGLIAFGVVLGFCAQSTGRLGMGVLAHASFNATTVVLLVGGYGPWG